MKKIHKLKSNLVLSKQINIEIHPEEKEGTWDEAVQYCKSLGEGWRLPTIQELWYIYEEKELKKEFSSASYWSSTDFIDINAWYFFFSIGLAGNSDKTSTCYVRAVRDIK